MSMRFAPYSWSFKKTGVQKVKVDLNHEPPPRPKNMIPFTPYCNTAYLNKSYHQLVQTLDIHV